MLGLWHYWTECHEDIISTAPKANYEAINEQYWAKPTSWLIVYNNKSRHWKHKQYTKKKVLREFIPTQTLKDVCTLCVAVKWQPLSVRNRTQTLHQFYCNEFHFELITSIKQPIHLHCVSKNAPTLKRYSSKLYGSILMIFGRNIQKTLE